MNKTVKFFRKWIRSVEIVKDNVISTCYFQMPFYFKYLSQEIKDQLINKSDRSSDQERLKFFFNNIDGYKVQMKWIKKFAKIKGGQYITRWQICRLICLVLVMFINIGYLLYHKSEFAEGSVTEL